ncbi:MAG: tetratricopeptide repeat protein [Pyrinomonadaceae bacterium]
MPRTLKLLPFVCALAALLPLCAPAALAWQGATAPDSQFEQAIVVYHKGDFKSAVKEFRAVVRRRKDDPLAWVFLAQALTQRGELKEARKALDTALNLSPDYALAHASLAYLLMVSGKGRDAEAEVTKAISLDPKLTDGHYVLGLLRLRQEAWLKALEEAEAVIKLDPTSPGAYSLKTQALLELYDRGNAVLSEERRGTYDYDEATIAEARAAQPRRLKEASESLAEYLRLQPDAKDADELRDEIETLRAYAEASASVDPLRKIYAATEGITRAVITFKPEPGFTDEARNANIQGLVRLRAVLADDGMVKHILVLRRLSYGLTEKAVKAARQIKFKPATLGGRPVSQFVVLEYNFNIY